MNAADNVDFAIKTALVCDDIRREDNGKQILIGVYNDKILVPQFPAPLALSFWIQGMPSGAGTAQLSLRLTAGESEFLNNKAPVGFKTNELSSIAVGAVACFFQQASDLVLQAKINNEEQWRTVKVVRVEKNTNVVVATPVGSAKSS